ncbi:class I SAM-dependent methyltransferase [Methylocystis rosea]|uniref:Class I SAM-dependent methyltransferase n=1 Tax=Methylocystis rosea TaxID=173366 RepID=A0ABX6EH18_9HYPH|nr:class I SAM-dependent methyltransferase [Methylocystis rosea]QGM93730.1 class I SAM-dependent methyltransferase [Methylocystis rosea]
MRNQYQTISRQYSAARKDDHTNFLETPTVQSVLGDLSGVNAIDYACGTGHYSRLLKRLGAKNVLGVDLSPAMIEAARHEEVQNPLGVSYEVADGATMAVFGSFDVATAAFLFNYAEDEQTLAQMFRSVAANVIPDGRLVAVVPNPDFINGREDTLPYGFFLEEIGEGPMRLRVRMTFVGEEKFRIEFTQWSRHAYEDALAQAGFADAEWTPFAVSKEGIERHGQNFWDAILANPKSVVLSARKKPA